MSSYTIVSLKLDFEPPKGGLAVSAVWKLACLLSHIPIGTKEHAKTHRRLPPFCDYSARSFSTCSAKLGLALVETNIPFLSMSHIAGMD